MSSTNFKHCSKCGKQFSLEDFLTDPHLEPIGISTDYHEPRRCHFYFCHTLPECMTSMTVPVEFFLPGVEEPVPEESLRDTPACPRHCSTVADLRGCSANCTVAPYRRFILRLMKMRESRSV